MKGIILAAGKGTRMYPMTLPVCKPLIPVYDKPLIYYPMAVLMQAGIRDILIIVPPDEMYSFIKLFGDGSELGLNLSYRIQKVQRGIADAFLIGESFIGNDSVCLILGDNIFYGEGLRASLRQAAENRSGATVFGYYVDDPRPFGVVEMDENGRALSIEEKPAHPKSNYIIPGLYFYDSEVTDIAKTIRPSARGELEITAVNNVYLERQALRVVKLGQDFTWLDAGNAQSLLRSANTVMQIQQRTGTQVACLEEIAYRMGYITLEQLRARGLELKKTDYGAHILRTCESAGV
ncbi:MAG: glucose-1-phosphate thymidylyltransferase RfbA [Firmicutes bacterium]|nr:glucose-1-phosphate thymidylyltransferase RfbA [Bacillota bacterium]